MTLSGEDTPSQAYGCVALVAAEQESPTRPHHACSLGPRGGGAALYEAAPSRGTWSSCVDATGNVPSRHQVSLTYTEGYTCKAATPSTTALQTRTCHAASVRRDVSGYVYDYVVAIDVRKRSIAIVWRRFHPPAGLHTTVL